MGDGIPFNSDVFNIYYIACINRPPLLFISRVLAFAFKKPSRSYKYFTIIKLIKSKSIYTSSISRTFRRPINIVYSLNNITTRKDNKRKLSFSKLYGLSSR